MSDTNMEKARALMAADLAERGGRILRVNPERCTPEGLIAPGWLALYAAADMGNASEPVTLYRRTLAESCGASGAEIYAAVIAIQAGKNPESSLPGMIEQIRARAEEGAEATEYGTASHNHHRSTEDLACTVLDLLCGPASPRKAGPSL